MSTIYLTGANPSRPTNPDPSGYGARWNKKYREQGMSPEMAQQYADAKVAGRYGDVASGGGSLGGTGAFAGMSSEFQARSMANRADTAAREAAYNSPEARAARLAGASEAVQRVKDRQAQAAAVESGRSIRDIAGVRGGKVATYQVMSNDGKTPLNVKVVGNPSKGNFGVTFIDSAGEPMTKEARAALKANLPNTEQILAQLYGKGSVSGKDASFDVAAARESLGYGSLDPDPSKNTPERIAAANSFNQARLQAGALLGGAVGRPSTAGDMNTRLDKAYADIEGESVGDYRAKRTLRELMEIQDKMKRADLTTKYREASGGLTPEEMDEKQQEAAYGVMAANERMLNDSGRQLYRTLAAMRKKRLEKPKPEGDTK